MNKNIAIAPVSSEVTGMLHDCVEAYYGSLLTAQTHAVTASML